MVNLSVAKHQFSGDIESVGDMLAAAEQDRRFAIDRPIRLGAHRDISQPKQQGVIMSNHHTTGNQRTTDQRSGATSTRGRRRLAAAASVGALLAAGTMSGVVHANSSDATWSGCGTGMPVSGDLGALVPPNVDPGPEAREALLGGMLSGSDCETYALRSSTSLPIAAEPTIDALVMNEGEQLYFAVELVATEAAETTQWEVGQVEQRCYTFAGDGTFLNPGFPRLGEPGAGTWQRVAGADSGFEALVTVGPLELSVIGTVLADATTDDLMLNADVGVSVAGGQVLALTSQGTEVDSCPA